MTTAQIAQKYGVPIPETCIALNWQEETLFYWVKNSEDDFIVAPQQDIGYWVCDIEDVCIPAPQMHEIASFYAQAYAELYLKLKNEGVIC